MLCVPHLLSPSHLLRVQLFQSPSDETFRIHQYVIWSKQPISSTLKPNLHLTSLMEYRSCVSVPKLCDWPNIYRLERHKHPCHITGQPQWCYLRPCGLYCSCPPWVGMKKQTESRFYFRARSKPPPWCQAHAAPRWRMTVVYFCCSSVSWSEKKKRIFQKVFDVESPTLFSHQSGMALSQATQTEGANQAGAL